jgi:hypothetical protein
MENSMKINNLASSCFICFIFIILINIHTAQAQDIAGDNNTSGNNNISSGQKTEDVTESHSTWLYFYGNLQKGEVIYMPCEPLEGPIPPPGHDHIINPQPYDKAWGVGMGIDYRLYDYLALSFDAGMSTWEKLLIKEGGYGVGSWVLEQRSYSLATTLTTFPNDVIYYMDTVYMRPGVKYIFMTGFFQPYAGLYYGFYKWKATIGNKSKELEYATDSGSTSCFGVQAGVDLVFDSILFRFYWEYSSPLADPKFNQLFYPGWEYESTGGQNIDGLYKIGFGFGVAMN